MGWFLGILALVSLVVYFVTEYWWIILAIAVFASCVYWRRRSEREQAERKAKALAEFEQIVPIDPLFTDLAEPLKANGSDEEKNNSISEMNLLMWAAKAVCEYHTIDELRNPVSNASALRNQRGIFADDMAVISAIYRTCKISYQQCASMIPKLVELNLLVPTKNGNGYTARLTANEFNVFSKRHENGLRVIQGLEPLYDLSEIFGFEADDFVLEPATVNMDTLSGEEFEAFCADLLAENGFSNIELTKHSGDHGVDILAQKQGITYAIQCKCYSSTVGNSAVQQVFSGKSLYGADVAAVMTNSRFSKQAIEDAAQLRVRLWDREKLIEMQTM